ncbi:MAG: 1-acyl-sn-glycerol-3-phosphate acyltransferase [Acidobacteriia bacterium]|nr:1-acyl-sn-glycerol-3-phosphate acyltransferase [Terriglobia bacterium]
MIRACFVTFVIGVYILILGPPLLLYMLLTGNSDPVYAAGKRGARLALWLAGVHLEVSGLEKFPRDRTVVFMANHQGNCDPPALLAILPTVSIVAKKEFFRIPILNRAMLARGFIPVDRKHREAAIAAVNQAVRSLQAGHSFLVFPEGTRSRDGRLQPLKKGVFIMAMKVGAPILPVSISGSSKIMAKGKFVIHPGRVRITVHDPVPTEGHTLDDRQLIMDRVRQALLAGLAPEECPLG